MSAVVPHRLLFRYRLPVRRRARIPKKGRRLLNLPRECNLPDFGELQGVRSFAEFRAAWNEKGLGISVAVEGKRHPVAVREQAPLESDGLQVWIDTRNTQSIHRASRFCHHFCVLPRSAAERTSAKQGSGSATAVQLPIARARQDAPIVKSNRLRAAAYTRKDGYTLEFWMPAETLNGYEPEANPLLGFYYVLRDSEWGEQYLTVGREFPFDYDPSLWCTLDLTGQ